MAVDRTDLATLLRDACVGRFPPPDGGWSRIPPWRAELEAVVGFTGHAFFAVNDDVTDRALALLGADGYGGAHHPSVVLALAGANAWIDSLDVVLVVVTPAAAGGSRSRLVERPDLGDHPRARFAIAIRNDVRVLGYPEPANASVVTIGEGLGGLWELGVETDGGTDGAALLREALVFLPSAQPVVAAVAPGNARALRGFLRAGFRPVASVQLFTRAATTPARNPAAAQQPRT